MILGLEPFEMVICAGPHPDPQLDPHARLTGIEGMMMLLVIFLFWMVLQVV